MISGSIRKTLSELANKFYDFCSENTGCNKSAVFSETVSETYSESVRKSSETFPNRFQNNCSERDFKHSENPFESFSESIFEYLSEFFYWNKF
jgi:hypothetical protein